MNVSYPSNNYRFGDIVPLTVRVDNTKGKKDVREIKVNLKRMITLMRKERNINFMRKQKVYEKYYSFNVNSNCSKQTEINFQLTEPDLEENYNNSPYGNNVTNYNDLLPTVESLIISCRYYIKASCYFSSYVTDGYKPAVTMPIAISHQVNNNKAQIINNQNAHTNSVTLTNENYEDFIVIKKNMI